MSKSNYITPSNGYLLVCFGGRPIMALPANSRQMKLAGISCYRNQTIRRAIFSWGMRLATMTGADILLFEHVDSSLEPLLPFNFADLLDSLRESLGNPSARAVIVWPPQPDRGRVYVHLLGLDGQLLAFVKLSLDTYNDDCLLREARTLDTLRAVGLQTFRVPSVIKAGFFHKHRYLILQPIPTDAKPVKVSLDAFPTQCVKEYAGATRIVDSEQLKEFIWWQRFWEVTKAESSFAQEVRYFQKSPLRVCRVHGDLGIINMMRVNGQLWIFDWEESCDRAPHMTDEIVFFLILNQRKFIAKPFVGLRAFTKRYLSGASQEYRQDVVMALAFLYGVNWNLMVMKKLVHYWDKLNNF